MNSIGVIAPYDFALDRELWRWVPDEVTLHITRTRCAVGSPKEVGIELAEDVSNFNVIHESLNSLRAVEPDIVLFACAAGSFVNGRDHDISMHRYFEKRGPKFMTASGALIKYLNTHHLRRVATVTPYPLDLAARLSFYLEENDKVVTQSSHFEMRGHIWETSYQRVYDAALGVLNGTEDALFLSCTNLPTYDIIVPLEEALGIPVLSTNRVMMSAALQAIGELDVDDSVV